jgi:hypothetical protein
MGGSGANCGSRARSSVVRSSSRSDGTTLLAVAPLVRASLKCSDSSRFARCSDCSVRVHTRRDYTYQEGFTCKACSLSPS